MFQEHESALHLRFGLGFHHCAPERAEIVAFELDNGASEVGEDAEIIGSGENNSVGGGGVGIAEEEFPFGFEFAGVGGESLLLELERRLHRLEIFIESNKSSLLLK